MYLSPANFFRNSPNTGLNLASFIGVVLLVAALAVAGCIRYEEYTDVTFAAFLNGVFNSKPEGIFNNYNMLFGWAPVLEWLQTRLSGLPVYGFFVSIISVFWVWQCSIVVRYVLKKKRLSLVWMVPVFFGSLIYVVFFQITQAAILVQGTSVLLFLLRLEDRKTDDLPGWGYLVPMTAFGASLRLEAFFLIFVLFTPYFFSTMRRLRLGKIVVFILYFIINISLIWMTMQGSKSRNADDSRYAAMRGYKVAAWDQRERVQDETLSTKEKAVLQAFEQMFMADVDQCHPDSLSRMGFPIMDKEFKLMLSSMRDVEHRSANALFTTWQSIQMMGFAGPLVAVLWLLVFYQVLRLDKSERVLFLVSQGWLAIVLMALAYTLKMEARFLQPVMWLNLGFLFTYCGSANLNVAKDVEKVLRAGRLLALAGFVLLVQSKINQVSTLIKEEKAGKHWHKNAPLNKYKYIIYDFQSAGLLFNDASDHPRKPEDYTLMTMDFGYYCYYQSQQDFWRKETGKRQFADQIDVMSGPGTLWLTSDERVKIICDYMYNVYGMRLLAQRATTDSTSVIFNNSSVSVSGFTFSFQDEVP